MDSTSCCAYPSFIFEVQTSSGYGKTEAIFEPDMDKNCRRTALPAITNQCHFLHDVD